MSASPGLMRRLNASKVKREKAREAKLSRLFDIADELLRRLESNSPLDWNFEGFSAAEIRKLLVEIRTKP